MNQLGINHTEPVGHQPYPGFVMNQLGINHTGLVGHQPYPGFVMKKTETGTWLEIESLFIDSTVLGS